MRRISTTVVLGVLLALVAFGCSQEPTLQEDSSNTNPLGIANAVVCDGNEILCDIAIALEQGTGIVAAGVGLVQSQPGNIDINVPGDVKQVIAFWEGFNLTDTDTPDDEIIIDGNNVTGTLVGPQHYFFSTARTSVHRADITGLNIVQSGPNSIPVEGMDFTHRNNGVGILVIYDAGGTLSEIGVKEGADAAYRDFPSPRDTTVPQTFYFTPVGQARQATLYIFASSVGPGRPNVVEVTIPGTTPQRFVDKLDDADGQAFDTQLLMVDIPANASQMTVQALSETDASSPLTEDPASLVWLAAGLSVPPVEPLGCRVTGGTDEKSTDLELYNTYSSGGQAGASSSVPKIYGEWSHTNHKGPDGMFTFHAGTSSAPPGTMIDWIECSDPGWCVQARPAPAKQIDFGGIGSFRNANPSASQAIQDAAKNKTLHYFEVNIDDLGEPGKAGVQNPAPATCEEDGYGANGGKDLADCDCPDFYRITIWGGTDPGTSSVIYEVSGYISKGDFQIHPPLSP